jgi:hypothetical protein
VRIGSALHQDRDAEFHLAKSVNGEWRIVDIAYQ